MTAELKKADTPIAHPIASPSIPPSPRSLLPFPSLRDTTNTAVAVFPKPLTGIHKWIKEKGR